MKMWRISVAVGVRLSISSHVSLKMLSVLCRVSWRVCLCSFQGASECHMYYLFISHKPSGLLYLPPVISPTYLPDCLLLFLFSL